MKQGKHKFLFRFPRIAAIVFIAFISMFALDIFGNGYTFRQTVVGLFMHLIPTRILIIALILSRKRYPLVGAILFGGFGLRYMATNLVQFLIWTGKVAPFSMLSGSIIIGFPAFLVGLCFFFNRRHNRKK